MAIASGKGRDAADVREIVAGKYRRSAGAWLKADLAARRQPAPEGDNPPVLEVPFGIPTEREAARSVAAAEAWMASWLKNPPQVQGVRVVPSRVYWHAMGGERIVPERITFDSYAAAADWIGEGKRFSRALERLESVCSRGLSATAEALADERRFVLEASDADFARLLDLLGWMLGHRPAGCFIREVPVQGVDTKWLEQHKAIAARALSAETREEIAARSLAQLWGFRTPKAVVRVRHAQVFVPGFPVESMSALAADVLNLRRPAACVIFENIQTGLSAAVADDVPVLMGMGYGFEILGELNWLESVPVFYLGDLDIHGLDILSGIRARIPHVRSLCMDLMVLENWRELAIADPNKRFEKAPANLTARERALFNALNARSLRLEQERIPIGVINEAISQALAGI